MCDTNAMSLIASWRKSPDFLVLAGNDWRVNEKFVDVRDLREHHVC